MPVIVPDHTAPVEFMDPGTTGLTFRAGDASDLAAKMREMLDDERVSRMGRAAYDRVWGDPPTMERHLGRLLPIYEGALRR